MKEIRSILVCIFLCGSLGFVSAQSERYQVYLFMLDDCKICQYYAPQLQEWHKEYKSDSINFLMLFPNFSSKPKNINQFKLQFKLDIPHQTDYFKIWAKKFDIKILPTAVVFDQKEKKIVYKGRIDNAYYTLGQKRRVINQHELKKVLSDILNNTIEEYPSTASVGCFVNYSDKISN